MATVAHLQATVNPRYVFKLTYLYAKYQNPFPQQNVVGAMYKTRMVSVPKAGIKG